MLDATSKTATDAMTSVVSSAAAGRRGRSKWWRRALLAVLLASCSGREKAPPGWTLEGDGATVRRTLEHLGVLSQGPLPLRCAEAAKRIDDCERVRAVCVGEDCDLLAALRCEEGAPPTDDRSFRVTGNLVDGVEVQVNGSWRQSAGGEDELVLDVSLDRLVEDWAQWLPEMPSATGAVATLGTAWLNREDSFLHARFRPRGGLALGEAAAMAAPEESRGVADRLYGLGSNLFSRAVLEGTVEVVLYPPAPGGEFPGVALAAAVRSQQVARSAIETYLEQMVGRWSFTRSPYSIGEMQGSCVEDLRVLPELAPCFVLAPDALFLGWNRSVLERALAGASVDGAGWMEADFGQWSLADERLADSRDATVSFRVPFEDARAEPLANLEKDFAARLTLQGSRISESRQLAGEGEDGV